VSEQSIDGHSDDPKNINLLGNQNPNDSLQNTPYRANAASRYMDSSVDPMNIGMSPSHDNKSRIPRRIQLRPQAKLQVTRSADEGVDVSPIVIRSLDSKSTLIPSTQTPESLLNKTKE